MIHFTFFNVCVRPLVSFLAHFGSIFNHIRSTLTNSWMPIQVCHFLAQALVRTIPPTQIKISTKLQKGGKKTVKLKECEKKYKSKKFIGVDKNT